MLGINEPYGTTQVLVPSARATLRGLARATADHDASGSLARAIACVPRRWAMIASTGADPDQAMSRVRAIVDTVTTSDTP